MPSILTPTRQDYINKLYAKIINLSAPGDLSEEQAVQILNTLSGQLARLSPTDSAFTQASAREVVVRMFTLIITILERIPQLLVRGDVSPSISPAAPLTPLALAGVALPFQILAQTMLPFLSAEKTVAAACQTHLGALFALVSLNHPSHRPQLATYLLSDLLEAPLSLLLQAANLARLYAHRTDLGVLVSLFTLVYGAEFRLYRVPCLMAQSAIRWELVGRKLWYLLLHYKNNFLHTDLTGEPLQGDNAEFIAAAEAAYLTAVVTTACVALQDYQQCLEGIDPLPLLSDLTFNGTHPLLQSALIRGVLCYVVHLRRADEADGQAYRIQTFALRFDVEHFLESSHPAPVVRMLCLLRYAYADWEGTTLEPVALESFGDDEADRWAAEIRALTSPLWGRRVSRLLGDPSLGLFDGLNDPARSTMDGPCDQGTLQELLRQWLHRDEHSREGAAAPLEQIRGLGRFICVYSGNYDLTRGECLRCEGVDAPRATPDATVAEVAEAIHSLVAQDPTPLVQTEALLALTIVFEAYVPVLSGATAAFAVAQLQLPVREARLLAARLMALLLEDMDLRVISEALGSIPHRHRPHLAEGVLEAWGAVALCADGDGLLLSLCKLVEFMGAGNPYHQSVAFQKLRVVAVRRHQTPYQLLAPFWPVVGFMVVSSINEGSLVLLARVSELVGVTPAMLLQRTAPYTVAHALTMYKADVLLQIAAACGCSKFELVWEWKDRCLAKLLMDWDTVDERRLLTVFRNACPEFARFATIAAVATANAAVWEVLKYNGEDLVRARVHAAVVYLTLPPSAVTVPKKNIQTPHPQAPSTNPHPDTPIQTPPALPPASLAFFRTNILGVVQNFSEAINDTKGTQPLVEKQRALSAVESLVRLCGGAVVAALPQIHTCLQASMAVRGLDVRALGCWAALVGELADKDLAPLVHSIVGVVLETWLTFSAACTAAATALLRLVFARDALVARGGFLSYVFTLTRFPTLADVCAAQSRAWTQRLNRLSAAYDLLEAIAQRAAHANAHVVSLALRDLATYLRQYQFEFHDAYLKKRSFSHLLVPRLVATLLQVASRFRERQPDLAARAAACLGQLGCLDPTRFNAPEPAARAPVVVEDFADNTELVHFLLRFVNDVLVPRFWAATEPHAQLFLAYAMQEYLKRMGLDASVVGGAGGGARMARVWAAFDDTAQSILAPLLLSRYTVKKSAHALAAYPIYAPGARHPAWLRAFTLDMLRRSDCGPARQSNAAHLFFVATFLLKDADLAVCRYLLPYAVLHMLLVGDAATIAAIRAEVVLVLQEERATLPDVDNTRAFLETVFGLMDYLRKWIADAHRGVKRGRPVDPARIAEVERLVEGIPRALLARRSAEAGAYERGILYLEQCLTDTDNNVDGDNNLDGDNNVDGDASVVSTLQHMYAAIDDVDALNGILTRYTTQTLDAKLSQFKYNDNWKMAQESYEALTDEPAGDANRTRLLESLNKHALYPRTLTHLDNRLTLGLSSFPPHWVTFGLDAALHSGSRVTLERWVFVADAAAPLRDPLARTRHHVARALVALARGEPLEHAFHEAYRSAGEGLSAAPLANAPYLTLLHAVHDAEEIALTTAAKFESTRRCLAARLANVGDAFETNWQLLSMRKGAEELARRPYVAPDVGDVWLTMARVARQNGRFDLATKAVMNAMVAKHPHVDLENAEMLWALGEHSKALRAIEEIRRSGAAHGGGRAPRAAVQLLYTQWLDASSSSSTQTIVDEFSRAIELDPVSEDAYFHLAKYCNKVLDATRALPLERTCADDFGGEFEKKVVHNYGRALSCGPKYLYEALPKLVTIWLDFAATFREVPKVYERSRASLVDKRGAVLYAMLQDVASVRARVPAFYWYTVFPQVLSRISHPSEETRGLLVTIAAAVAGAYPAHALWSIFAQAQSVLEDRALRGRDILAVVAKTLPAKQLAHARQLFEQLFAVTEAPLAKGVRSCLLRDTGFAHSTLECTALVAPLKQNFTLTLPASPGAVKNHSPFPQTANVTIVRVEDQADVIASLQRPKRVFYLGSDGRRYSMLCKRDDVRKDSKFMDVMVVLNRLLGASYECAKRRLEIETYAVVALNEDHGIIEWVENVKPLRTIIAEKLKSRGVAYNYGKIGKLLSPLLPFAQRRQNFLQIVEEYPVGLPVWFLEQFPDPVAWYRARNRYARTCAVMSMVCYVLGIGDRHGENLLFRHNGSLMHVDFDCIFEKGLTLAVPEVVPFRLTTNMMQALGVSGIEGTFRRLAELAMHLIRDRETTLMNLLESFIYDPIMDWTRKGKTKNTPEHAMRTIRRKIRGILDREGLPMSVQGQVEFLTQEATKVDKLCEMYHGWMPYM